MKKFKDVIKNSEAQTKKIAAGINKHQRGGRILTLVQSGWHSWVFIAENHKTYQVIFDNVDVSYHMFDGGGIHQMLVESYEGAILDRAMNSLEKLLERLDNRNIIREKSVNDIILDTDVVMEDIPELLDKLFEKHALELDF